MSNSARKGGFMQVYVITSVVNSYEDVSPNYGAASVWYEVFRNKEDAVNLLKEWGCEPLSDAEDTFARKKEKDGCVYNFYYKINSQFLGA